MRTLFLQYIAFFLVLYFVALNIVAEPIPYNPYHGAEKVAITLYIPATKVVQAQGYIFSETDMNQCLAWGEETKMWRKKATDIVKIEQNSTSEKYLIAVMYFVLGAVVGGVVGYFGGKQ